MSELKIARQMMKTNARLVLLVEQVLARRHISLSTERVITDQDDPDMQFYMQELFKLYKTNPTMIQ